MGWRSLWARSRAWGDGIGVRQAATGGRIRAVAFAAGVAAACGVAPTAGPTFAVRDSLGIEIVESAAPLWAEGEGWILADEPELVIGTREGDERYLLADVRGARRLSDGSIAVLDAGSNRVRVYSAGGQHRFDLGGAGDGPSEFRTPQFMDVIGDTIVVYEYFPGSLTWFSADGEFLRTAETPRPADGSIIRGMVFGILHHRDAIAMPRRMTTRSKWWTPAACFGASSGERSSLARSPHPTWIDTSASESPRRGCPPMSAPGGIGHSGREALPRPCRRSDGSPSTRKTISRPDGAWLGSVEVPDGLPSTRGGLFQPWVELGSDYFLGVWVGELGVEQVRLYPRIKR